MYNDYQIEGKSLNFYNNYLIRDFMAFSPSLVAKLMVSLNPKDLLALVLPALLLDLHVRHDKDSSDNCPSDLVSLPHSTQEDETSSLFSLPYI